MIEGSKSITSGYLAVMYIFPEESTTWNTSLWPYPWRSGVPTENAQSRLNCADRGIVKDKNRAETTIPCIIRLEIIEGPIMG